MQRIEGLIIGPTSTTPRIDFNNSTGEMVLKGISIPENPSEVYEPLIEWTGEYIKSPNKVTNLHINLEYFNSASLLGISEIIRLLSMIDVHGSEFYIQLYFAGSSYDDREIDDTKDIVMSLVKNKPGVKVQTGIKVNITDKEGQVIKSSTFMV